MKRQTLKRSMWSEILSKATEKQKLEIQSKLMKTNDCETKSRLKGLNTTTGGSCANVTGLPCSVECHCYKDKAPGDCFAYDQFGYSLPCPQIDSNITLATARNETSDAKVFEASSVMGTCSKFAKYLSVWSGLTAEVKQKIIDFLSNPSDPSITYQDVAKMPIEAFAAANRSMWSEILSKATEKQKLEIQSKLMKTNDCETKSRLKGLNTTTGGSCANVTGLPCSVECHCYKDKAPGDCFAYDQFGYSLPCPQIDSNITLATARNETSDAKVFEASSVMGTCSKFAKYLSVWSGLTAEVKQKIIDFLSNPSDPSITYQDVAKMPIEAFAVANRSMWSEILSKATEKQKLEIQSKLVKIDDCETKSKLKGLNITTGGSCANVTGLPCLEECPCYKDKKPDDCFAYDQFGYPLPCPQIDSDITLATARNETSDAKVFEASSVMGTCSKFAKYLSVWSGLTAEVKQKIIDFLSNPSDPNITYQDVAKMPIEAFAAANKTMWHEILSKATDRQKLEIQLKIMKTHDCELQSMLKGLNFTQLYKSSETKGEVDSSIFELEVCNYLLRNCSSPDIWQFINTTATVCLAYISQSNCRDYMVSLPTGSMPTLSGYRSSPMPSGSPTMPSRTGSFSSPTGSMPTLSGHRSSPMPSGSPTMPSRTGSFSSPTGSMPTLSGHRSSPMPSGSSTMPNRTGSFSSPTGSMPTLSGHRSSPMPSGSPTMPSRTGSFSSPTGSMPTLSGQRSSPMPSGSPTMPSRTGSFSSPTGSMPTLSGHRSNPMPSGSSTMPSRTGSFSSPTGSMPTLSGHRSSPMPSGSSTMPSRTGSFSSPTGSMPTLSGHRSSPMPSGSSTMPSRIGSFSSPTGSMPTLSGHRSSPMSSGSPTMPSRTGSFSSPTGSMPTLSGHRSSPMSSGSPTMPSGTRPISLSTGNTPTVMPSGVRSSSMVSVSVSRSMPISMTSDVRRLPTTASSPTSENPPVGYAPASFSGCDAGVEGIRCPQNCSTCYNDKLTTDCYSYDKYGNFLGCRSFAGNATMMKALNDTTAAAIFDATAEIGTCSRLAKYLRKWISMDNSTKEKSKQFLTNPTSVSDDEVERLPVEVFAVSNMTLLANVAQHGSTKQKLYLAKAATLTRSCLIQDHMKAFNLEQEFKDARQSGAVDAAYFDESVCKAYMAGQCDVPMSKWQFVIDNAQDCLLDKAVCLKDVTDATLDTLLSAESIKQLCSKPNIDDISKDLFRNRLNSYLSSKTAYACDRDFFSVVRNCSLAPKFVTKFCNQSRIAEFTPTGEQSQDWNILKTEALADLNVDYSAMDKSTLSTYLPVSKSTMKSMNGATLTKVKELICTDNVMSGDRFDEEQTSDVMDILREKGVLDQTADRDCFLKYDPSVVADALTDDDLIAEISKGTVNATKLTSTQSFKAMEHIRSNLTTDAQVKDNAVLIVRNGADVLSSFKGRMSEDTVSTILETCKNLEAEDKVPPSVKSAAIIASIDTSNLARSLKTIMLKSSKEMLAFVPVKTIEDLPPAQLQSFCGSEAMTADLPEKMSKSLMSKCQKSGTQLDPTTVSNMLPMVGAAPKTFFDTVPNDSNCSSVFSKIVESKTITAEKYDYVCSKLQTCLSSSGVEMSDASTLSGNALACFSKTTLNSFQGSCADISAKMCSADFSLLDGKDRKTEIKEYITECLQVTSATITESQINSMGGCVQLLGDTEISKMDQSATEAVISSLSDSEEDFTCWDTMKKYVDRFRVVKGSSTLKSTDIITKLKGWTVCLESTDFSGVTGLCDTISAIGKSLKRRKVIKKTLKKAGLFKECKEELDDIKTEMKKYISAAIQDCSSARRRKRSTASLTCSQLTALGSSMLSSLTTSQLSGIQDSEFTQCASLLGTPSDYSTEQKQTLAEVAKRTGVYSTPSTWTTSTIQSLGSILQGLTSSELNTMQFTYDDIAQLGAFDGWDDSQKTTIFGKWSKSSAISTITSSELRSLGHMTCAMSTSQIQQITTSIYEESADKIGEVTSCSDTQMVEFATHAKSVYGSTVYNWTSIQITSVGAHIGGLSKTEIITLTEAQIDEILASHVTIIPSSIFSGFSATQLGSFSAAQAQATTTTQRSTLDSSQLSALETAAGTTFTTPSGADRSVRITWLAVTLSVLLAMIL
ncbi:uncharacterized protein LOC125681718 isoform X2 [Ostrea edulis]|uniref:uncharacterized protein LOC125681718 isoform X2 n=1 Tax=Ostrea edulis TaxID=37623 RepID=UPI0024AF4C97|nr:uncharacterized protein LOC125681718 isoform X2 [Ostrea edulis]